MFVCFVESLGFPAYDIISEFYFFLFNVGAFYFLSVPDCTGRTSNAVLNSSGESGSPCLVPDLPGKAFGLPPLSLMLTVCFSHLTFPVWRQFPSHPSVSRVVCVSLREPVMLDAAS